MAESLDVDGVVMKEASFLYEKLSVNQHCSELQTSVQYEWLHDFEVTDSSCSANLPDNYLFVADAAKSLAAQHRSPFHSPPTPFLALHTFIYW